MYFIIWLILYFKVKNKLKFPCYQQNALFCFEFCENVFQYIFLQIYIVYNLCYVFLKMTSVLVKSKIR